MPINELLTTEDLVLSISEKNLPVIFIDTCVFLDIIRSPFRDQLKTETISNSLKALKMIQHSSQEVILVTNETVSIEWLENIDTLETELKKHITKLSSGRKKLLKIANLINKSDYSHGYDEESINLNSQLKNLSHSLLNNCLVLKREQSHKINAMDRVFYCIPPARRGKSEAKDCEIFESFLDIAKRLKEIGFTEKICFTSSNTQEYGFENNQINNELQSFDAKYAVSLSHALNQIK